MSVRSYLTIVCIYAAKGDPVCDLVGSNGSLLGLKSVFGYGIGYFYELNLNLAPDAMDSNKFQVDKCPTTDSMWEARLINASLSITSSFGEEFYLNTVAMYKTLTSKLKLRLNFNGVNGGTALEFFITPAETCTNSLAQTRRLRAIYDSADSASAVAQEMAFGSALARELPRPDNENKSMPSYCLDGALRAWMCAVMSRTCGNICSTTTTTTSTTTAVATLPPDNITFQVVSRTTHSKGQCNKGRSKCKLITTLQECLKGCLVMNSADDDNLCHAINYNPNTSQCVEYLSSRSSSSFCMDITIEVGPAWDCYSLDNTTETDLPDVNSTTQTLQTSRTTTTTTTTQIKSLNLFPESRCLDAKRHRFQSSAPPPTFSPKQELSEIMTISVSYADYVFLSNRLIPAKSPSDGAPGALVTTDHVDLKVGPQEGSCSKKSSSQRNTAATAVPEQRMLYDGGDKAGFVGSSKWGVLQTVLSVLFGVLITVAAVKWLEPVREFLLVPNAGRPTHLQVDGEDSELSKESDRQLYPQSYVPFQPSCR